jgi:hypothetical protein
MAVGDHPPASEHVGGDAAKRRGQRDRKGRSSERGADLHRSHRELLRHERQHRLRGIEIDECRKPGERHRHAAQIRHCEKAEGRRSNPGVTSVILDCFPSLSRGLKALLEMTCTSRRMPDPGCLIPEINAP